MLEGVAIHPHSKITAKNLLLLWLLDNTDGMEHTPENAVKLANLYPGFVDVSYLMNVWEELKDE